MIDLGQVFTKKKIADYMVNLFDLENNSNVLDPCYGEGVFLESLVENQNEYIVTGIELDKELFFNSQEKFKRSCTLKNMDFLIYDSNNKYDGIIMNPPYIRHEKIDDLSEFGITKKQLSKNPIFRSLPSSSNMYAYFVCKAINMLKNDGQLIVIFPGTWIKAKGSKQFRKFLDRECYIEKVIHVKGDVFEKEALVEVVIMKLIKSDKKNVEMGYTQSNLLYYKEELIETVFKENKYIPTNSVPVTQYAKTRRGLTTGYNEMFIGNQFKGDVWKPHLSKIISSPKSIPDYDANHVLADDIFIADLVDGSELELEIEQYLDNWKNIIKANKQPKVIFEKIESGVLDWYRIKSIESKGIIFSYIIRNGMKFINNDTDYIVRDNFYILTPKIDKLLLFALLNNYYTFLQLEHNGKKYGAGLLKIQKYDLDKAMLFDISLISNEDILLLKKLSSQLIKEGDKLLIDKISKVISKYSSIDYPQIKEMYEMEIKDRLGGKL